MKNLFSNIKTIIEDNNSAIFAVITEKQGSGPRGTGAWMLFDMGGIILGTVGGGQIEKKVLERGQEMLQKKEYFYDEFFTLGVETEVKDKTQLDMICGGGARVWLCLIDASRQDWKDVADQVQNFFDAGKQTFLAINSGDGKVYITQEKSEDTFLLSLAQGPRVIIFGGGHVAQALVPVLASVGFRCTVFENREFFVREELFPKAEKLILGDYTKVLEQIDIYPEDYIIIMTHGHSFDYELQRKLLTSPHVYLGVMGSRRKKAAINAKLLADGISQEMIDSVHTPIGLEIEAETPEEIAISIAAECIRVRRTWKS